MPNRSVQNFPYNSTPQDNFFLIGSEDNSYGLFRSRIIDVISQKYNPNSGWQLVDGSTGNINSELNSRYYVSNAIAPFDFILPNGIFGDTFTLYSETANVGVRNAALNRITDVIPLSLLHLFYNGNTWVNFSTIARGNNSLFVSSGFNSTTGFTKFSQGRYIDIPVSSATITSLNLVRYLNAKFIANNIVRANITARPTPPKINGKYLDVWIHQGVVTKRHNQSYQQGSLLGFSITKGVN